MATRKETNAEREAKRDIRIQLVNHQGNVSFLVGRIQAGSPQRRWVYLSQSEQPLALSNIASENAAKLRFALEDSHDATEAVAACKRLAKFAKTVEAL